MTLIEILVAVMIVSIGLLGVARMEILAKQSNADAIERTTATQLAHDMIEKMRANPKQLALYVGKTLGLGTATTSYNCDSTSCKDTELVSWDLYQWDQALIGASEKNGSNNTGGLDTPRGCITGPSAGGPGVYQIDIAWKSNAPLKDNSTSTCGQNQSLYGTSDVNRRVLTLSLYISDDGV